MSNVQSLCARICRSDCLVLNAFKSFSLSAALSLSFSLNLFRKLKTQKESFHPKMYCFPTLTSQNCRYINCLQYSSCFASKLKRFARAGFYRVRTATCRSHSAKAAERQIRSKGESSPSKNWKELHVLFFAESGRRCHPTCQMLPGGKSVQKENLWNYFPVKLFKVKALKYHWIYPWE